MHVDIDMCENAYVEFISSGVDDSSHHMAISIVPDWSLMVAFVTETSIFSNGNGSGYLQL